METVSCLLWQFTVFWSKKSLWSDRMVSEAWEGSRHMGLLNMANIRKAIYYLQRNGILDTIYAAKERMEDKKKEPYTYKEPSVELLARQRSWKWRKKYFFSIVVPLYRTPKAYLKEMILSVLNQTYPDLELILADATEDGSVEEVVRKFRDARIRYVRLEENKGISENTGKGISLAQGDYIGLLDHDDILTPDALFEMAFIMNEMDKSGVEAKLLYSDEDKCNGDATSFYEPHWKEDFNLELLLSNNYICHFMMIQSELMKKYGFRKEFDGAQDYDLVLRTVASILPEESQIVHIPKVLYHWRCHTGSTAENPKSKQYAYENGRLAVQDFAKSRKWTEKASHLKHVGFYRLEYPRELMRVRPDIGAVGGKLITGNKISGGIYDKDGTALYKGLHKRYTGYMHKAVLRQEADSVDVRSIQISPECRELFEQATGVPYVTEKDGRTFDWKTLPKGTDYVKLSLKLCRTIREAGYKVLWDPVSGRKLKRK